MEWQLGLIFLVLLSSANALDYYLVQNITTFNGSSLVSTGNALSVSIPITASPEFSFSDLVSGSADLIAQSSEGQLQLSAGGTSHSTSGTSQTFTEFSNVSISPFNYTGGTLVWQSGVISNMRGQTLSIYVWNTSAWYNVLPTIRADYCPGDCRSDQFPVYCCQNNNYYQNNLSFPIDFLQNPLQFRYDTFLDVGCCYAFSTSSSLNLSYHAIVNKPKLEGIWSNDSDNVTASTTLNLTDFLRSCLPMCSFNLSHSGDAVAGAVLSLSNLQVFLNKTKQAPAAYSFTNSSVNYSLSLTGIENSTLFLSLPPGVENLNILNTTLSFINSTLVFNTNSSNYTLTYSAPLLDLVVLPDKTEFASGEAVTLRCFSQNNTGSCSCSTSSCIVQDRSCTLSLGTLSAGSYTQVCEVGVEAGPRGTATASFSVSPPTQPIVVASSSSGGGGGGGFRPQEPPPKLVSHDSSSLPLFEAVNPTSSTIKGSLVKADPPLISCAETEIPPKSSANFSCSTLSLSPGNHSFTLTFQLGSSRRTTDFVVSVPEPPKKKPAVSILDAANSRLQKECNREELIVLIEAARRELLREEEGTAVASLEAYLKADAKPCPPMEQTKPFELKPSKPRNKFLELFDPRNIYNS